MQAVLSLKRDLARIGDWCKCCGLLVNPMKTRMTLARIFPNLVFDGTVVERVTELKVLGVVLATKLSFESHIRSMAASASSKLGINPVLVLRCFWSFLLPVLRVLLPELRIIIIIKKIITDIKHIVLAIYFVTYYSI